MRRRAPGTTGSLLRISFGRTLDVRASTSSRSPGAVSSPPPPSAFPESVLRALLAECVAAWARGALAEDGDEAPRLLYVDGFAGAELQFGTGVARGADEETRAAAAVQALDAALAEAGGAPHLNVICAEEDPAHVQRVYLEMERVAGGERLRATRDFASLEPGEVALVEADFRDAAADVARFAAGARSLLWLAPPTARKLPWEVLRAFVAMPGADVLVRFPAADFEKQSRHTGPLADLPGFARRIVEGCSALLGDAKHAWLPAWRAAAGGGGTQAQAALDGVLARFRALLDEAAPRRTVRAATLTANGAAAHLFLVTSDDALALAFAAAARGEPLPARAATKPAPAEVAAAEPAAAKDAPDSEAVPAEAAASEETASAEPARAEGPAPSATSTASDPAPAGVAPAASTEAPPAGKAARKQPRAKTKDARARAEPAADFPSIADPAAAEPDASAPASVLKPAAAESDVPAPADTPEPVAAESVVSAPADTPGPVAAELDASASASAPEPVAIEPAASSPAGAPEPAATPAKGAGDAGSPGSAVLDLFAEMLPPAEAPSPAVDYAPLAERLAARYAGRTVAWGEVLRDLAEVGATADEAKRALALLKRGGRAVYGALKAGPDAVEFPREPNVPEPRRRKKQGGGDGGLFGGEGGEEA